MTILHLSQLSKGHLHAAANTSALQGDRAVNKRPGTPAARSSLGPGRRLARRARRGGGLRDTLRRALSGDRPRGAPAWSHAARWVLPRLCPRPWVSPRLHETLPAISCRRDCTYLPLAGGKLRPSGARIITDAGERARCSATKPGDMFSRGTHDETTPWPGGGGVLAWTLAITGAMG